MNAIGQVIYNLLYSDVAIKAQTGGRIMPNVIEQGVVKGDYIVYYIQQYETIRCQGNTSYIGIVGVFCGSSNYKRLTQLLALVNTRLEKYSGEIGGINVTSILNMGGEGDEYIYEEKVNSRELQYKVIIN